MNAVTFLRQFFHTARQQQYADPQKPPEPLSKNLQENITRVKEAYGNSDDLTVRELTVQNRRFACLALDNMVSKDDLNKMLLEKLTAAPRLPTDAEECFSFIERSLSTAPEQQRAETVDELPTLLASGFALLLLDGCAVALALGVQHFPARGVEAPRNEEMERAAHEPFVEVLRLNVALLRRRMKTPPCG